ncbi:MAG: nucleoside hydrolase [Longimicrobiales bacterium]
MTPFKPLGEEQMRRMLSLPEGTLRVVIDTDAKNEIDDQYAMAWALLSQDRLEIEGMYAAPFSREYHRQPLVEAYQQVVEGGASALMDIDNVSWGGSHYEWAQRLVEQGREPSELHFVTPGEGTELSYHEILKVYELLEEDSTDKVFRGSDGFLASLDAPLQSEAVDHLIERALADDDRPLYVVAIGALTNIASAILIEPKIMERIVVIWTSAYPSFSPLSNRPSMNLVQDVISSQLLFESGVPHVYLPGYYIGSQLSLSLPDTERWVKGRGKIGDYLHELYVNNPVYEQFGLRDHFGRTWIGWDLVCIAWLLNPDWVPSELVPAPVLDDELYWQHPGERHWMREATSIQRDQIYRDFFQRLETAP